MQRYGPNIPYFIVATKSDLRYDKGSVERLEKVSNLKPITMEQGIAMAERVGAAAYLELTITSLVNYAIYSFTLKCYKFI